MIRTVLCLIALVSVPFRDAAARDSRPNVLVILADDLGYADVGFQGCRDIPTPNLDRLAKRSVRCTNGYVTHSFCSPTRAALLAGRYQQRFGHERNPAWLPESTVIGMPVSEPTVAEAMRTAGYATGCVGKWHLGAHPMFHPNRRGFDEFVGLLHGGHVYIPGSQGSESYTLPLDRNGKPQPFDAHLTDMLGREAAAFISHHKGEPWFLYLAFNAPHTPLQPDKKHLDRVRHIEDPIRRKYAGLIVGMDDAIGEVLQALEATGQTDSTLLWFFSDNGGPTPITHSDNAPLRGVKGQVYEGGVRVPFLISRPGHLPEGTEFAPPVTALDVFATAAALASAEIPSRHPLEGVNLLPYLTGEATGVPHVRLFWRMGGGARFAVRVGDWKVVGGDRFRPELFNLANDIGESTNLAAEYPDIVSRLQAAYDEWNKDNIPPAFENPSVPKAAKRPAKQ